MRQASSTTATLRRDLAAVAMEYDAEAAQTMFIGTRVAPVVQDRRLPVQPGVAGTEHAHCHGPEDHGGRGAVVVLPGVGLVGCCRAF